MLIDRTETPRVCPVCDYVRDSTHCKHFVGYCVPEDNSFGPDECTVPGFHGMPVSNRITMTSDGDSAHVESYWMDYETGIDAIVTVVKQLNKEVMRAQDATVVDLLKPSIPILQYERDFIERVCDAVNVYAHADAQLADKPKGDKLDEIIKRNNFGLDAGYGPRS